MTIEQFCRKYANWPKQSVAALIASTVAPTSSLDPQSFVAAHGQDKISENHIASLNKQMKRLEQGEPVQYILGTTEFGDLKLTTDKRALIPRQETEELVDLVIAYINSSYTLHPSPFTLVDIGTGSGAIALSLAKWAAKNNHNLHIIATDISQDALDLATENYSTLLQTTHYSPSLSARRAGGKLPTVSFLHGSLLDPILEPLDIIIANLPYIPSHWLTHLDANVKDYEPHVALDGGSEGLDYIRMLLNDAPRVLKPGGKIFLELWHEHKKTDFDPYLDRYDIELKQDSFGKNRFAILTLHPKSS